MVIAGSLVIEDLESDSDTEVGPSFGSCSPIVVIDSDVESESVIVLDSEDDIADGAANAAVDNEDGNEMAIDGDAGVDEAVSNAASGDKGLDGQIQVYNE